MPAPSLPSPIDLTLPAVYNTTHRIVSQYALCLKLHYVTFFSLCSSHQHRSPKTNIILKHTFTQEQTMYIIHNTYMYYFYVLFLTSIAYNMCSPFIPISSLFLLNMIFHRLCNASHPHTLIAGGHSQGDHEKPACIENVYMHTLIN